MMFKGGLFMRHQGARAALLVSCSLLAACGAKTLDFNGPDGGSGASGGSAGASGGGTGGGGASGNAGAGGTTGGDGGTVTYVSEMLTYKPNKIDLLFMIDNSSSMADKQESLSNAVPALVDRLVDPLCIDPATGRTVGKASNGICAVGVRAFEPINDIHIGIISSSLGAHGAPGVCNDAIDVQSGRSDPHNDDRGHLVTRGLGGASVPTYQNKGFLYFNPSVNGALSSASQVATAFTDLVKGVGQHGCGYEASLEAVYRFLVDPEPYNSIAVDTIVDGHGVARLEGTDDTLLRQRADFLRPDSLVSVVYLTDENDCSIADGGQGFHVLLPNPGTGSIVPRGTSKCLDNPNDKCCVSCGAQAVPDGCTPVESDPECQKGPLSINEDPTSLRCFKQKQRYGTDFLYPVQRYIDGFTKAQVPNRQGQLVKNPLFSDLTCPGGTSCSAPRHKSLVWVTGIVGVPWQDISLDPNDLTTGYKTAKQLRDDNTWAKIVGDPHNAAGPVPPNDPHMIESIQPRPGLPGPSSAVYADPIHGHEWDPSKDTSRKDGDLQYACTFPLRQVKICLDSDDCDCSGPDIIDTKKPVCQNTAGAYTNTQLRGKAYPSTRILEVLQGLGDQAIVGSICPANVSEQNRDDYGYSPVVNAVIDRLREPLRDPCLGVALPADASGQTPCSVIEVWNGETCGCDSEPGRRTAPEALLTEEMKRAGNCRCEIKQLTGTSLTSCRGPAALTNVQGWCYVDPAQRSDASCDLVKACQPDRQRRIRFTNVNSEPRPGSTAFLRCEAAPIAPLPSLCR